MGLGKTCQVICALNATNKAWTRVRCGVRVHLYCGVRSHHVTYFAGCPLQALVVCPLIMLQTWKAEFNRFAPALSVEIFRESTATAWRHRDARVSIMSYEEAISDQDEVKLRTTDVVRCIILLLLLSSVCAARFVCCS